MWPRCGIVAELIQRTQTAGSCRFTDTQVVDVASVERDGETIYFASNRAEPAIVQLPANVVEKLLPELDELRERAITYLPPEEIKQIDISQMGREMSLIKSDDLRKIDRLITRPQTRLDFLTLLAN